MLGCQALEVYRGIDDFMVVVESEAKVKDMRPDFSEISKLIRGLIVTADGLDVDLPQDGLAHKQELMKTQ